MDSPNSRETLSTSTPPRQRQRALSPDPASQSLTQEHADSPLRKKPRLGDSNSEGATMSDQSVPSEQPASTSPQTSLLPDRASSPHSPPSKTTPSKVTLNFRKSKAPTSPPTHPNGTVQALPDPQDADRFIKVDAPSAEDVVDDSDSSSHGSAHSPPVHEISLPDDDEEDEEDEDADGNVVIRGPDDPSLESEVFEQFPFCQNGSPEDGMKRLCTPFDTESTVQFRTDHLRGLASWLHDWVNTVSSSRRSRHRIYAECGDFWDSMAVFFWKMLSRRVTLRGSADSGHTRARMFRDLFGLYMRVAFDLIALDCDDVMRNPTTLASAENLRSSTHLESLGLLFFTNAGTGKVSPRTFLEKHDVDAHRLIRRLAKEYVETVDPFAGTLSQLVSIISRHVHAYPSTSETLLNGMRVLSGVITPRLEPPVLEKVSFDDPTTLSGKIIGAVQVMQRVLVESIEKQTSSFSVEFHRSIISYAGLLATGTATLSKNAAAELLHLSSGFERVDFAAENAELVRVLVVERLLLKCLSKGRMELRVLGVTLLAEELVGFYNTRLHSGASNDPYLQYMAEVIANDEIVEYIVSAKSHPQLISKSQDIIGFLFVTKHWPKTISDAVWHTVSSGQDARIVEAVENLLTSCFRNRYPKPSAFIPTCEELARLPLRSFNSVPLFGFIDQITSLIAEPDLKPGRITLRVLLVRLLKSAHAFPPAKEINVDFVRQSCLKQLMQLQDATYDTEERRLAFTEPVQDLEGDIVTATGAIDSLRAYLCGGRVSDDRSFILEELAIPSMVANNLRSFVEHAGSSPFPPPVVFTGLQARLQLLMELFHQSTETHLDSYLEKIVWDNLVGQNATEPIRQEMGWRLLADLVAGVGKHHLFVEHCIHEYVQGLDPELLSKGFVEFSKATVMYTRRFYRKMPDEGAFSDRLSDLFWKTILHSPHEHIFQNITHILCSLHVDLSPNRKELAESLSESHAKVVERCINQLRASATELNRYGDATAPVMTSPSGSASNGQQALVSEDARFTRALGFLRLFLSEVRNRPVFRILQQNKSPSPQLASVPGSLGDPIVLKYQSVGGNGKEGRFHEFEIGSLATYGELYLQLCRLTGFSDFAAYVGGQRLEFVQNSSCTVATLAGKGHILIKSLSENAARRPSAPRGSSRAEDAILAHLDEIYTFLDLDSALSCKVYEFLGEFPPQQNILTLLAPENFSLKDMFPFGKFYKTLHHLRSLRSILQEQLKGMQVDLVFVDHGVRAMTLAIADPNVGIFSSKDGGSWSLIVDLLQCLSIFLRQLPFGSSDPIVDSNILIQRLVDLLISIKGTSNADLDAVAKYSYENLTEVALRDNQIWFDLKRHASIKELHFWLLLSHQNPRVRDHVRSCVENFAKRLRDLGSALAADVVSFYWNITTHELMPYTVHDGFQAKDVLLLTSYLFQFNEDVFRDKESLRSYLSTWSNLLLSYRHEEQSGQEAPCEVISGLARILNQCLACMRELGENMSSYDLIEKIVRRFLFPPISAERNSPSPDVIMPILHTDTRKELFVLVMSLCNDANCLGSLGDISETFTATKLDDADLPVNVEQLGLLRSPAGYVGLRNLANTCYMNSLLTQLFMNRKFRDFILNADVGYDRDGQKLLASTQELFASMQFSQAKWADTEEFAESIVPYDAPQIDIALQMDVDEFYNLISDRWEGQFLTQEAKDKFRSFYGGEMITQIKSRDCEHVSERSEPYLAVSCEVKGRNNLEDSLSAYVEGDAMEGDNKYKCESCDGRLVDAVKRSCFKDVPDNLIIHLKRFDFDLVTLLRSKINERFEFPADIDMSPYKAEHLNNPELSVEKDVFELTGILVHNGNAEGGHYYSYIKMPKINDDTKPRWVEFNDTDVGEFDSTKIPDTCFGGAWDPHQPTSDITKQFNAYMLFYQRKSTIEREEPRQPSPTIPDPKSLVQTSVPGDVAKRMQTDNETRIRWYCLLDPSYACFIEYLLIKFGELHDKFPEDHELALDALHPVLKFIGQVGSRAKDAPYLEGVLSSLIRTARRCSHCCFILLEGLQTDEIITNILVQHPIQKAREWIMRTLAELLGILRVELPSAYGLDDSSQSSECCIRSDIQGAAFPALATRLQQEIPRLGKSARHWSEYFLLWCFMVQSGMPEALFALDRDLFADCLELLLISPEQIHFSPRAHHHENLKILSRKEKQNHVSYHGLIKLASVLLKYLDPYGDATYNTGFRNEDLDEATLKVPVTRLEQNLLCLKERHCNILLTKVIDNWDRAYDEPWCPGEIITTLLANHPPQNDVNMMANTIAQSINEYYLSDVGVVLTTALVFCRHCPTLEDSVPIMNAAVASATQFETFGYQKQNQFGVFIDHASQGGGSHLKFFNELAFMRDVCCVDDKDSTPYMERVTSQAPYFSPPLLMFDHQNVRLNALEFLRKLIFDHFPKYSEPEEQPSVMDQVRTEAVRLLFHRCLRVWFQGVKASGIPTSFGDPTYTVLRDCTRWLEKLTSPLAMSSAYEELISPDDSVILSKMQNVEHIRSQQKDADIEELGSETENVSDIDEAESAISDA